MANKVLILMGSDSDFKIMRQAAEVLQEFGVECEVRVLSVHRVPEIALETARTAEKNGFNAIIAGAGMAAHLAGAVAGHTVLPVIGVPIASGPLHGQDALYSTVMMPPGVPVGTMAIDGARNAGIFALQVLGVGDESIREKLHALKRSMADKVLAKDRKIQEELQA
jgi:5-(carboxyamino)imidazole ribonucleotide mutase